ncbi:MAG: flagellar basal-body MS-ring/collar protein FliF, partial [Thiobacillus sp.]
VEYIQMAKTAGKYLLMALLLLILYLRVLKPMLKKLSASMAPPPVSQNAQLQHADAGVLALPGQRNYQDNLARAQKMANEDPRVVANIVKTWVGSNE